MVSARTAQGKRARGSPAEASGTTPQRASRAATRRARSWSGVTRAAVRPGVSRVSRSRRAAARAQASTSRVPTTVRPPRPSAMPAGPRLLLSSMARRQSAVWSAGRRARLMTFRRISPATSPGADAPQFLTASRGTPAVASRLRSAAWGCWSSTWSASFVPAGASQSSPGRTTAPRGVPAITFSSRAVALTDPVEPAAIRKSPGGAADHFSARAFRRRTLRLPTSSSPSASSRAGHRSRAPSRKSSETFQWAAMSMSARPARLSAATSSICRLSKKAPRASARPRASVGPSERPRPGASSVTSRRSSNLRRTGVMAGGRSRTMSPGSKGASPASRSPRGRTRGGSRAGTSPAARRKASVSDRAARRVGVRTTASARASGPPSRVRSRRPSARSSRNGRSAGMLNHRGPGDSKNQLLIGTAGPRPHCAPRDRRRAARRRP